MTLLLKIQHTLIVEHRETELELIWETYTMMTTFPSAIQVHFRLLGEKKNQWYPELKPPCSNTILPGSCLVSTGGRVAGELQELTTSSVDLRMLHKREFIPWLGGPRPQEGFYYSCFAKTDMLSVLHSKYLCSQPWPWKLLTLGSS